jgi:hypothetical protein
MKSSRMLLLLMMVVSCAGQGDLEKQEASAKCTKKGCHQMSSCSEAMYNYQECGNKELDKDGDGQPCDYLCTEK